MRLSVVLIAVLVAGPAAARGAAAQSEAQRLILAAKEQLTSSSACRAGESAGSCASRRLDSSAALLRRAAALPGAGEEDKVEAWIWLGIGQFYAGKEDVTRSAFREALVLRPQLQANLEHIDSTLARLLEGERTKLEQERAATAQAPTPQPAAPAPPAALPAPGAAVTSPRASAPAPLAVRAGAEDDIFPEVAIQERPQLTSRVRPRFPDEMVGRGFDRVEVLIEFVVDTVGRVERNSIRVISSPSEAFNEAATRAVRDLRFRAGRHEGRAVRVRVQLPLQFEAPRPAGEAREDRPDPTRPPR